MATTAETLSHWRSTPNASGEPRLTKRRLLLPAGCLTLLAVGWMTYLVKFGFSKGLDSTSPEFGKYWYTLLAFNLLVLVPVLALVVGRWAVTRCKTCAAEIAASGDVSRAHELEHHWRFLGLVLAGAMCSFMLIAVGGAGDAAWHQSVLRDTSITPIHTISFYGLPPLLLLLSLGAYIYARTRLPKVWSGQRGLPYAYLIFAGGQAFMFLLFTLNEFGHAVWIFEERFTYPMHKLFVPFQASQLAFFPIAFTSLLRVARLLGAEDDSVSLAAATGGPLSASAN